MDVRPEEKESLLVSVCGVFNCVNCVHRKHGKCSGCTQGNALLAAHAEKQCDIFVCARSHNIASCNDCTEPTCPFTRSTRMVCPVRERYENRRCFVSKMSAHFSAKQAVRPDISLVSKKFDKAITRLPWYLFAVREFMKYGVTRASSDDIAHKVGVKSWVVRRDLSQFGEFGRPSLGYELSLLQDRLARVLHLDTEKNVIWIGASRLSADKSLVQRFMDHNHRIVAVFDTDLSRVPEMVGGLKVQPVSEIAETIEKYDAKGAVLATSAEEAQGVADILVAASVFGILNLTSTLINVPAEICVRNVDVVAELFSLSYYCGELHGAKSQQA